MKALAGGCRSGPDMGAAGAVLTWAVLKMVQDQDNVDDGDYREV